MLQLRCYFLDKADRIGEVEEMEAPSLDAAIARGRELLQTQERLQWLRGIEIWDRADLLFTDAA